MNATPTPWGRMVARLQGEVPATTLEAYRRASLQVFELMDQVEARRQACAAAGMDPWTVPSATRAAYLCAWNAFVLQTLGNDILDADYAAEPVTVGYVPPVTADQVLRFFSQVEGWVTRAQQAQANPDYVLDVTAPAELPSWSRVKPCPPAPAPVSPLEVWAGSTRSAVLPGNPAFDIWCLSDPDARVALGRDAAARRALRKMWKLDPDPARTLAIHEEIRSAFERGDVAYAEGSRGRVGHFDCCPWGPVFAARRKVTIGGTKLRTMEQFVYDVGARNRAEPFRRRIVVGTFQQTKKVEYGPYRPPP